MPDDKTKVGEPDRSRVAGDQDYEVRYVAEKYGLSVDQVKKLIARVGNDREKIEAPLGSSRFQVNTPTDVYPRRVSSTSSSSNHAPPAETMVRAVKSTKGLKPSGLMISNTEKATPANTRALANSK